MKYNYLLRTSIKSFITLIFLLLATLSAYTQYVLLDADVTVENGAIIKCSTSSVDWGTGDIVIPEILDDQRVREIKQSAFESKGITSVVLPQSLEIIGDRGFAMNEMVDLTIPKSVTYLGKSLLAAMNTMRNVYFEDFSNIRIISAEALFVGSCVNCINPIVLPDNADPAFGGYRNLNGLLLEPGDTIKDLRNVYYAEIPVHTLVPEDVIMDDSAITGFINRYPKIVIPENIGGKIVNTIGSAAFNNVSLIEVKLPSSIEYLSASAFSTNYIGDITFPESLKVIGNNALDRNRLVTLTIPDHVSSVGDFSFSHNRLSSVVLSESISHIGTAAFNGNQVITLNGIETNGLIFQRANNGVIDSTILVSYCGKSDTVDFIPGIVKRLDDHSFRESEINKVVLPEGIEAIGTGSFFNNSLDTIILPSGILRIEQQAFGANYIKNVVFRNPSHLEYLGNNIFSQNYQLDSVVLPVPEVKTGYSRFLGWFDDNGDSISVIKNLWNPEYTAKFEPILHFITYINVDVNSQYNPPYYTIESNYYLDEPPNIPGYLFAGWFTDPLFNDTISEPAIPRGSTGDLVFYAKWKVSTGFGEAAIQTVKVYPVPFSEVLNISVAESYEVTVFDAKGFIIRKLSAEVGVTVLNMESNHPGMYFIKLSNASHTFVKKVIKE
ncbi:MAG: leucine-rich repeat protein [Bacteroidales bacterium]|nr:leucine-rich repeat protein [Bacteroidales bacterium]